MATCPMVIAFGGNVRSELDRVAAMLSADKEVEHDTPSVTNNS